MNDDPITVAAPLLAPEAFFRADALAADPRLVPSVPGIYGWWFGEALPGVPTDDSLTRDGLRLLYVGIAPSGPRGLESRKVRSLRDRLKNHTRGPIAQSTLRRTLTSLLRGQLGLTVTRRDDGKFAMPAGDESRLTAWMSEHARVAWMPHANPWEVEEALITTGPRLPLNIRGSADPFRLHLKRLRAGLAVT